MHWIFVGFAILALLDLSPLILSRQKRTILAFLILFFAALALSVMLKIGVQIPSILIMMQSIFYSIGLHY